MLGLKNYIKRLKSGARRPAAVPTLSLSDTIPQQSPAESSSRDVVVSNSAREYLDMVREIPHSINIYDEFAVVDTEEVDDILTPSSPYTCLGKMKEYPHIYLAKKGDAFVVIKAQTNISPRADELRPRPIIETTVMRLLGDCKMESMAGYRHIVRFDDHTPDFKSNTHLLVMEHCIGGSLLKFMTTFNSSLTFEQKIQLAHDFTSGIEYLHYMTIAHRDIKPDNVFIAYDPHQQRMVAKIGDFGSSVVSLPDAVYKVRPGTVSFAAPELFDPSIYYSPYPCDVWAYGATLYAFFEQRFPFPILRQITGPTGVFVVGLIISSLEKLEFRELASHPILINVIRNTFNINPTTRPTISKIKQSKLFRDCPAEPITRQQFTEMAMSIAPKQTQDLPLVAQKSPRFRRNKIR